MAAAAHHMPTFEEKKALYFRVFWYLVGLTVIELLFVQLHYLHVPKVIVSILVCVASVGKAVLVGYYYMHLNHETKWLKFIALLPIIAFFYAAVLAPDSTSRPESKYFFAPDRVYPEHISGSGELHQVGSHEGNVDPRDAAAIRSTDAPGGLAHDPDQPATANENAPGATAHAEPAAPKAAPFVVNVSADEQAYQAPPLFSTAPVPAQSAVATVKPPAVGVGAPAAAPVGGTSSGDTEEDWK